MIKQAYINGFMRKCAQLGVNPNYLLKIAGGFVPGMSPLPLPIRPIMPRGKYDPKDTNKIPTGRKPSAEPPPLPGEEPGGRPMPRKPVPRIPWGLNPLFPIGSPLPLAPRPRKPAPKPAPNSPITIDDLNKLR